MTLRALIAQAWKVRTDEVQGGDSQALDAVYDLSATTPDGQPWTMDSVPPMLRQFLIERFHVAVHPGTKQVSGYGLFVAKGGSKLKPATVAASGLGQKAGVPFENSIMAGYVRVRGMDMDGIASMLSIPAQNPVVNRTGIPGIFDMDLHFATDDSSDSNWLPFIAAVEEELGLKLESQKVTVNTLVIDHVDREPTPN